MAMKLYLKFPGPPDQEPPYQMQLAPGTPTLIFVRGGFLSLCKENRQRILTPTNWHAFLNFI